MKRDRVLQAAGPGSFGAIQSWRDIALHSAAAAVFIFLLQRRARGAALDTSLLWALMSGGCADVLATMQSKR